MPIPVWPIGCRLREFLKRGGCAAGGLPPEEFERRLKAP